MLRICAGSAASPVFKMRCRLSIATAQLAARLAAHFPTSGEEMVVRMVRVVRVVREVMTSGGEDGGSDGEGGEGVESGEGGYW